MPINTDNLTSKASQFAYDATLGTQTSAVANNSEMTMDDFWQLLAAQLKYQDMTDPMSNSEMMQQMTQMSSMNTMTKLSDAISSIATVTNNLSQVTLTTYSTGLLGREVTIAITNDDGDITSKVKGTVTGVDLTGATSVYVDGKKYELAQIMAVGDVPANAFDDLENKTNNKTEGTTSNTQTHKSIIRRNIKRGSEIKAVHI